MSIISRIKSWFSNPNKPRIFDDKAYVFRQPSMFVYRDEVEVGTAYGVVCGPVYRLRILTKVKPIADEPETVISHYDAGPVKVEQLVFGNEHLNLIFEDGKVAPSADMRRPDDFDFELRNDKMRIGRCSIYKWNDNDKEPDRRWTKQIQPGVFANELVATTSIMDVEIDAGFAEINDEMRTNDPMHYLHSATNR